MPNNSLPNPILVYHKTLGISQQTLRKLIDALPYYPPTIPTISDFAERCVQDWSRGRAKSTQANLRRWHDGFLFWMGNAGAMPISHLHPSIAVNYLRFLKSTYPKGAVTRIYQYFLCILMEARNQNYLSFTPPKLPRSSYLGKQNKNKKPLRKI